MEAGLEAVMGVAARAVVEAGEEREAEAMEEATEEVDAAAVTEAAVTAVDKAGAKVAE